MATSSLELGIDMGAVDLVVQVEAPPSVASGIQRIGRAGHQVGAVSKGVLIPTHKSDLLACAALVLTALDYLRAEQGYRMLRLESARIGTAASASPGDESIVAPNMLGECRRAATVTGVAAPGSGTV